MSRRGGFVAAALTLAIGMMGTTIPSPLYELYRQRFGFSEFMITVIFATYAVGVITSLVLFGHQSDRIGRRPVLLAALAASALSSVCFLTSAGLPLLLIGRVMSGLSAGAFTGTATATLIDLAEPSRRTRATLIGTLANMTGLGLGPLIAGALAAWAGSPLRLVFWVFLALLLPAAVAIWASPEPIASRTHAQFRVRALRIPAELGTFFTDAAVAAVAGYAVLGLFSAVAPAFLGADLGVTSPAAVGLVVFSVFAASAVGQLMMSVTGQEVALPAGCAGLVVGMGLLALSLGLSSLALLIVAGVVAGIGHGLTFRAGLAGLNERAPAGQRAQVASSFFVVCYLAIAVPVIGEGVLTQLIGLRSAGFVFAAAVAALALAALILLARASGSAGRLARPVLHHTLVPKENPQ